MITLLVVIKVPDTTDVGGEVGVMVGMAVGTAVGNGVGLEDGCTLGAAVIMINKRIGKIIR